MTAELDVALTSGGEAFEPGDGESPGYLIVRVTREGRIQVQGSRAELASFMQECARSGLVLELECLSWCG